MPTQSKTHQASGGLHQPGVIGGGDTSKMRPQVAHPSNRSYPPPLPQKK